MALTFQDPALIEFNNNSLSDHNRSELSVDSERIERAHRTANGTMRKYHVADKRTFSVSWRDLPLNDADTVDGNWGAASLENFFNTTTDTFTMTIHNKDGSTADYTVFFEDGGFSKTHGKRVGPHYYDVRISVVEQ